MRFCMMPMADKTLRGFRQSEHLLSRYSPENQYFNRTDLFFRKGYTLLGWNTRADGRPGCGTWKPDRVESRACAVCTVDAVDRRGRFYIQKVSGFAVITGYSGKAQQICIPPVLEDCRYVQSGRMLCRYRL